MPLARRELSSTGKVIDILSVIDNLYPFSVDLLVYQITGVNFGILILGKK